MSNDNGMKVCPYCAEDIKLAAVKCRYCGSMLGARPMRQEWYRDTEGKMLGGVSSGLARQFGISVTALRVAFVIAAFVGGWGILIYLALWIIMPVRRAEDSSRALPEAGSDGEVETT